MADQIKEKQAFNTPQEYALLNQHLIALTKLGKAVEDPYHMLTAEEALRLSDASRLATIRCFPGQQRGVAMLIAFEIDKPVINPVLSSTIDTRRKDRLIRDFHRNVVAVIDMPSSASGGPITRSLRSDSEEELEGALDFVRSTALNGVSTGGEKPTQGRILEKVLRVVEIMTKLHVRHHMEDRKFHSPDLHLRLIEVYEQGLEASGATNHYPPEINDIQEFYREGISSHEQAISEDEPKP